MVNESNLLFLPLSYTTALAWRNKNESIGARIDGLMQPISLALGSLVLRAATSGEK